MDKQEYFLGFVGSILIIISSPLYRLGKWSLFKIRDYHQTFLWNIMKEKFKLTVHVLTYAKSSMFCRCLKAEAELDLRGNLCCIPYQQQLSSHWYHISIMF